MQTFNLDETLNSQQKEYIELTLTPLRIEQVFEFLESKPLSTVRIAVSNIGLLNGNYYLLEKVHEELSYYYKREAQNVI